MKIADFIKSIFSGRSNHVLRWWGSGYGSPLELTCHKFGETMFLNIAQLLTDLYAELEWTSVNDTPKWRAWKDWATRNGQRILLQLFRDKGYVVVGYHSRPNGDGSLSWTFYELGENAYHIERKGYMDVIECNDPEQLYYVLKSPTFEQVGKSDHELCKGYIAMIDAVFNGATTTAERLGAYVVMTPKTDEFGGVLGEQDKKDLEEETQRNYGMLRGQKQIMLLPRPMDTHVVSLASVDSRMNDKARLAILAIADRLKVPANQIAIIDSDSSKSLSNGTELREGDMSKYRSFRRLIDATFYDMAAELGMKPNYVLENEPKSVQGQTIEA